MKETQNEMFAFLSNYVSKSDIYAANAIAQISAEIFRYRKSLHMTQKEFAEEMGVSQGMVSKWESAEYNFSIENIAQIAEKMHMTFEIGFVPEGEYLKHYAQNIYQDVVTDCGWVPFQAGEVEAA